MLTQAASALSTVSFSHILVDVWVRNSTQSAQCTCLILRDKTSPERFDMKYEYVGMNMYCTVNTYYHRYGARNERYVLTVFVLIRSSCNTVSDYTKSNDWGAPIDKDDKERRFCEERWRGCHYCQVWVCLICSSLIGMSRMTHVRVVQMYMYIRTHTSTSQIAPVPGMRWWDCALQCSPSRAVDSTYANELPNQVWEVN